MSKTIDLKQNRTSDAEKTQIVKSKLAKFFFIQLISFEWRNLKHTQRERETETMNQAKEKNIFERYAIINVNEKCM